MKPLHERRRRSAREKFQSCKASYAGDYVYEVDGQNDYTRRGSLFHDARHRYIVALWRSRQTDDHELAERAWTEAATANPIPMEHRADARSLFQRWTERFRLNLDTYVDSETELMTHYGSFLRLDEVHIINGDTIRIIDAKTYWRIPSEEELRNEMQVAFYLGAVRRLFPVFTKREFVFDMVRFGVQVTVSLSESELDEFDALAAEQDVAMAKAEEDGDYPATPGDHCRQCVLQCDAVDHALRAQTRVVDAADARRSVKHLAVLHRHQEQLQAALRAYSDLNGPVEAGGIEWAHRPETRYVYPARDVQAVLDEARVPFRLLMSGSAVKPLVNSKKKYTHVADQIRALAESRTTTKFFAKRTHDLEAEPVDDSQEA